MINHVIGVDIGGTNIRAALLTDKLHLVKKEIALTTDFRTANDFLMQIKKMTDSVDPNGMAGAISIVLPVPWTSNKEFIADATNIPYLENLSVETVRKFFPRYKVYLENDVNVIALLESDLGAARESRNSVYITVSTGIGSGIIINNQIYHGANGYAGEIGSIIISHKECTREHPLKGSLEELCSGKALEQMSINLYGEGATARQLFTCYEEGEQNAGKVVERWFGGLVTGLAAVIQMMDPEIIVLGGPVILNHNWMIEKIRKEIPQKVLGQLGNKTKILAAEFGTEAGITGAAYYALKQSEGEGEWIN